MLLPHLLKILSLLVTLHSLFCGAACSLHPPCLLVFTPTSRLQYGFASEAGNAILPCSPPQTSHTAHHVALPPLRPLLIIIPWFLRVFTPTSRSQDSLGPLLTNYSNKLTCKKPKTGRKGRNTFRLGETGRNTLRLGRAETSTRSPTSPEPAAQKKRQGQREGQPRGEGGRG
jgi:hypothetical protein